MLNYKKSEENIRQYMHEGYIRKVLPDKNIIAILSKNSEESLETANFLMQNNKSSLWIIVCSYYSMYYIANAVICKHGYKVGRKISHAVTYDTLVVFIKNKLEKRLLEDYKDAMEEAADIARTESEMIIESFGGAKRFIETMKLMLAER